MSQKIKVDQIADLSATAAQLNFTVGVTASIQTQLDAKLPLSGGALTGAVTTNSTFDGRDVATDGSKLDGIEAGATADQTASEIRALVESATNSNVFTDADHTKLNGIEAGADVTDATNVTAAGALMDSEVTNLAQVKAFDSSDYATAAQGTLATNALPKSGGAMTGAITTNSTFDGRDVSVDGAKLDGIEAGADVTDTTNVAAAGALMDSEVDADIKTLSLPANTTISAYGATLVDDATASAARTTLGLGTAATTASTDYATAAQGTTADAALPRTGGAMTGAITTNSTFDGRNVSVDGAKLDGIEAGATADQTASEIRALVESATDSNVFTDADHTKLNGIEASADVTDVTNVTAAGALMDSEVTNLAQVKAFDSSDYATAAQGTTADAALPRTGGAMTGAITTNSTFDGRDVGVDGTKLDGIEASADVTDAGNVNPLVDSHLNVSTASANEALLWTGSDYSWGAAGISNVVEDTTPQLGGDLQSNGHDVVFADNDKAIFGAGSDLQIYHNGTKSIVSDVGTGVLRLAGTDFDIMNSAQTKHYMLATDGGAVTLYYDNAAKLATTATGVTVTGTLAATAVTGNGSGLTNLPAIANVVEDTTPQLGGDLQSNGHDIDFADNDKAVFGANADLEVYSDGTSSFVHSKKAGAYLRLKSEGGIVLQAGNSENVLFAAQNGKTSLYFDAAEKLETTSTGVAITGTLAATAVTGDGSGLTNLPASSGVTYALATTNPSSPSAGDAYYNTAEEVIKVYDGTDWYETSEMSVPVFVDAFAAGGGGGGSRGLPGAYYGGGGAGGVVRQTSSAAKMTPGTTITVSIGGGGAAAGTSTGGTGGTTTISGGSISLSATGGNGDPHSSPTGGSNADYSGATTSGAAAGGAGAGSAGNAGTTFGGPATQDAYLSQYFGGGGADPYSTPGTNGAAWKQSAPSGYGGGAGGAGGYDRAAAGGGYAQGGGQGAGGYGMQQQAKSYDSQQALQTKPIFF